MFSQSEQDDFHRAILGCIVALIVATAAVTLLAVWAAGHLR